MDKLIKGKVWKLGHDVDTDLIIAARYLNTSDPAFLASHCLEDLIPSVMEKINQEMSWWREKISVAAVPGSTLLLRSNMPF